MTKAAALFEFWNGFGIPFFPSTSVPDEQQFPYGTYEVKTSSFGDATVSAAVNLWYRTTQDAPPNTKAEEISKAIGNGGVTIPCDDGIIWIRRGSPFCQALTDSADGTIKRRFINVEYEFITI